MAARVEGETEAGSRQRELRHQTDHVTAGTAYVTRIVSDRIGTHFGITLDRNSATAYTTMPIVDSR
jgi:hypothetical protein